MIYKGIHEYGNEKAKKKGKTQGRTSFLDKYEQ